MFIQQLNTIFTLVASKYVDTGDKLLDNTLITLCVLVVSNILLYLVEHWRQYYNMIIYVLYGMWRHPLMTRLAPYAIQIQFKSLDEFYTKTSHGTVWLSSHRINQELEYKKHSNIHIVESDINTYLSKLARENHLTALLDTNGKTMYTGNYILYPIAVSKSGNVVYYDPSEGTLRTEFVNDGLWVRDRIYEYIIQSVINDKDGTGCDNIYVPFNDSKPDFDGERYDNGIKMKKIGSIHKKKTFDTLFYPQKAELMRIVKRFQDGTMYPAHIPMDNKLGILLYGPPGTGKTGTISAIANMLRRSIVVVNFTNITTCAQMDEILTPENYKKYVYVFDEFDCVLDVISGAPRPEANKTGTDWGSALLFAEGEERSKILTMMKEGRTRKADTPIDMAYLLQKLDGLESAEGRIIIATTNNPDKINPALLRPGRFDIKICLDLCTPNMVVDILANYYENDIEIRKKIVGANIVGNKYSPLELVNRAIQATDVDTLLKQLKE